MEETAANAGSEDAERNESSEPPSDLPKPHDSPVFPSQSTAVSETAVAPATPTRPPLTPRAGSSPGLLSPASQLHGLTGMSGSPRTVYSPGALGLRLQHSVSDMSAHHLLFRSPSQASTPSHSRSPSVASDHPKNTHLEHVGLDEE